MKRKSVNVLSDEVLAAYLDGNASAQQSLEVMNLLSDDSDLRELFLISQKVDAELGLAPVECELLPMTALAATCSEDNYCALECEKYLLNHFNIGFEEGQLLEEAIKNGWQKEDGTALHNVGRHLEDKGLVVSRRYKCSVEDIVDALSENKGVIVAVDGEELSGIAQESEMKDVLEGESPDHTVVVVSVDMERGEVTLFDPNSMSREDVYPVCQFVDAWNDSKNYLVTASVNQYETYIPRPIDLSDVELGEDLNELREAIAENAHDVWAMERIAQGWSYGPMRDDVKKENPCMVPYSQLPDSEKKFDREMAMNTIKLLKKLGYDLVKREEK